MFDNFAATSIPSDIHSISSSMLPIMSAHHQQLYNQMFGSLAELTGCQALDQPRIKHYFEGRSQKLRNTKSVAVTATDNFCNQDHLQTKSKQQLGSAAQHNRQVHNNDPLMTNNYFQPPQQQHYLTIEELKTTRNSCWLCGCNWQEDHVSLDCPECDGYALTRPCPSCDGKCKQIWQRNISATHDKHRALWIGRCAFGEQQQQRAPEQQHCDARCDQQTAVECQSTSGLRQHHTQFLGVSSASLCSSHPSSAATSDDEPDDFLSI